MSLLINLSIMNYMICMIADNFTDNLIVYNIFFLRISTHCRVYVFEWIPGTTSPIIHQVACKYTYTSQITSCFPALKTQLFHIFVNISDCIGKNMPIMLQDWHLSSLSQSSANGWTPCGRRLVEHPKEQAQKRLRKPDF